MDDHLEMLLRVLVALGAGAAIGYERSFHGKFAGFRTHALVSTASAILMLVTVYEAHWIRHTLGNVQLDPTRMAQGIMTGIGFLGAGTIMTQGLSVRGLTTAASIWITAAIGILLGIGFWFPALLATVLTLGTLSLFRWIEHRMPSQFYAHFVVRFAAATPMAEDAVRALLHEHRFDIANLNYRLDRDADFFEYRMVIRTNAADNAQRLSEALATRPAVKEFRLSPTGD